jgi:hypothetical protein
MLFLKKRKKLSRLRQLLLFCERKHTTNLACELFYFLLLRHFEWKVKNNLLHEIYIIKLVESSRIELENCLSNMKEE